MDYSKLDKAMKLSEYLLYLNTSSTSNRIELRPFAEWSKWAHSLTWYQEYNLVKHNRYANFSKANLENLLNAISGLFSLLFAQFYTFSFSKYIPLADHKYNRDTNELWSEANIFWIIAPSSWKEEELYWFNWQKLKWNSDSFQKFQF